MDCTRLFLALALGSLVFATGSGCSSDEHDEEGEGIGTQSTCPASSQLTYESFGKPFMEAYCTRCHSSAKTGSARQGAPEGHDFDTLGGILVVAEHIDENAAAGPAAMNTEMPPTDPKPSEQERRDLGEWLACEVARQ